jgi:hypothetical protein
MKWHKQILLLSIISAIFIACTDDNTAVMTDISSVEIVTVVSNNSDGALLQMQRSEKSEQIMLKASSALDATLRKGERIIIEYTASPTDTALRPVPVTIKQFSAILFDTVRAINPLRKPEILPGQVSILSQWRTGDFINLQVLANYDGTPRSYSMFADGLTLSNDTVKFYIFNPGDEIIPEGVGRRSYGSFYIGNLGISNEQQIDVNVFTAW